MASRAQRLHPVLSSWDGTNLKDFHGARSARVPSGYAVNVYDCAGPNGSWKAASFAEAFAVYQQFRSRRRDWQIRVVNLDRCDEGFDGLTDEEREALDEPGNAATAALIGPRRPCRVCGDLSLYGIHPKCEPKEIEKERFAMDKDDGRETDHEEAP